MRIIDAIQILIISSVFALTVILLFYLYYYSYGNTCSPLQESDMKTCLDKFGSALSLMDGDPYSIILDSWPYFSKACEEFPYLKKCLGEEIIENCLNFDEIVHSFSYRIHNKLGLLFHGADFACRKGFDAVMDSILCSTKHCKIDRKNCSSIERTISECIDKTKKICQQQKFKIFGKFLTLRECFKAPNCGFCKDNDYALYTIIEQVLKVDRVKYGKKELLKKLENMQNPDTEIQLTALKDVYNDLSESNPPIERYIENGFVQVFIELLDTENSTIQLEAVLCLQKIANSKLKQVEALVDTQLLPQLATRILTIDNDEISGKIIEIFAILITVKPQLREYFMDIQIPEQLLLSIFPEKTSKKTLQKIEYIFASICQSNDWAPTKESRNAVGELLPLLGELVNNFDTVTLMEITKVYINIKQGSIKDCYFSTEIIETFLTFLGHKNESFQFIAFNLLSGITVSDHQKQQHIFNSELLKHFEKFLKHSDRDTTVKAMDIISNISANNEKQIQQIIDANLLPQILKNFQSFYLNIRESAANLVEKIAKNGNSKHSEILLQNEIIALICDFLKETKSRKFAYCLLSAVKSTIVKLENRAEEIITEFAAHGGYDFVQKLVKHKNQELQDIASELRNYIINGYVGSKSGKEEL